MDAMMPPPPNRQPRIIVIEQPKQRGMRFRYECEGRSAGSIPGENTNQDRKIWPSIQIVNYQGEVTVRVSLVSKDAQPRPHPHSLVGKDCIKGICTVRVTPETQMTATFSNLGIQCVKRKEVAESLRLRHSLNVDPFNTYQNSDPQAVDIDLNIVRLCFEAFIPQGGNTHLVLPPVLSNPIFDKKATCSSMLRICRVDRSFGGCKGGDEVYLLCDKVQKDDISICFFELETGWEAYGEFSPTDVHRQVAIVFRTPPYRNTNITEATEVLFQLKRSSDGETSDSKDFTYLPSQHVQPQPSRRMPDELKRKFAESQDMKRQLQNHIVNKFPKHDAIPSSYSGASGTRYTMPSHPEMSFPRAFPPTRMQPPMGTTSSFISNIPRPSMQHYQNMNNMSRMELPQYLPMPQSLNYWPTSMMPQQNQNFAPPPTNATPMPSSSFRLSGMAPSPGPQTHLMPTQPNFATPVTNNTPMPQGSVTPSPGPSQDLTVLGSVTDDFNLDSLTGASFGDINTEDLDKGMNQLSIEPDTNFSDIIKAEPATSNMSPFPNTTPTRQMRYSADLATSPPQYQQLNSPVQNPANHNMVGGEDVSMQQYHHTIPPPRYSADEQTPNLTIQAASPQQFQQVNSPVQQQNPVITNPGNDMSLISLLPSFDLPSDGPNLPSFDLNDQGQLPSATDLEELNNL